MRIWLFMYKRGYGSPPVEGGDGVAKYSSSHIDGTEEDCGRCDAGNPEIIQEVKRILLEHAERLP